VITLLYGPKGPGTVSRAPLLKAMKCAEHLSSPKRELLGSQAAIKAHQ
jgi:hypothetical protein